MLIIQFIVSSWSYLHLPYSVVHQYATSMLKHPLQMDSLGFYVTIYNPHISSSLPVVHPFHQKNWISLPILLNGLNLRNLQCLALQEKALKENMSLHPLNRVIVAVDTKCMKFYCKCSSRKISCLHKCTAKWAIGVYTSPNHF